jgi:hypothetical protein
VCEQLTTQAAKKFLFSSPDLEYLNDQNTSNMEQQLIEARHRYADYRHCHLLLLFIDNKEGIQLAQAQSIIYFTVARPLIKELPLGT